MLRRLVGMLARKGYPPGLAVRVVRDALAERADGAIDRPVRPTLATDVDTQADADESADLERRRAAEAGERPTSDHPRGMIGASP